MLWRGSENSERIIFNWLVRKDLTEKMAIERWGGPKPHRDLWEENHLQEYNEYVYHELDCA